MALPNLLGSLALTFNNSPSIPLEFLVQSNGRVEMNFLGIVHTIFNLNHHILSYPDLHITCVYTCTQFNVPMHDLKLAPGMLKLALHSVL